MARKGWVVISCLALTVVAACSRVEFGQKPTATPAPASGPAAAVQSNQYKAEGVVKAVNPKGPAIEIDHGDIEGLMPAMQMEFPVTDANLLNGLAVNDRIDFTVENATDGMKVVAIKKK
ncbi:MAG TPA: copper-binding protein [Pyrinomonadaceae bacterium]|nr:copper-binding protein [Pyrinomonadaceae bacterium]